MNGKIAVYKQIQQIDSEEYLSQSRDHQLIDRHGEFPDGAVDLLKLP